MVTLAPRLPGVSRQLPGRIYKGKDLEAVRQRLAKAPQLPVRISDSSYVKFCIEKGLPVVPPPQSTSAWRIKVRFVGTNLVIWQYQDGGAERNAMSP